MAKQLSPAAVVSLKEALCSVYWYKKDMRSFLQLCLSSPTILGQFDWNNTSVYKSQIASDVIDLLIKNPSLYVADLTKICFEICKMTDFSHLNQLEDSALKIERAKNAVKQLKSLVEPHQNLQKAQAEIKARQEITIQRNNTNAAFRLKLQDLKNRYVPLLDSNNPQSRGFELEKIMYELFKLFDLDPKASFKNLGEQVDGAFSLDGTVYLFEAKWQKELVNKADLAVFSEKVQTKLENTLGLFLSINGFSNDGVNAHQAGGASILCMDGGDLMAIFEERIDFVTLLLRKKRHAAQTGSIYLPFFSMSAINTLE